MVLVVVVFFAAGFFVVDFFVTEALVAVVFVVEVFRVVDFFVVLDALADFFTGAFLVFGLVVDAARLAVDFEVVVAVLFTELSNGARRVVVRPGFSSTFLVM